MTQILMLRRLRIVRRVRGSGGDADVAWEGVLPCGRVRPGKALHERGIVHRDATAEQEALAVVTP